MQLIKYLFSVVLAVVVNTTFGQAITWSKDGSSYYRVESGEIVKYTLPANTKSTFVSKSTLTHKGADKPLAINGYTVSDDGKTVLLFTNSKKVWRYNTRGDYWLLNLANNSLKQIGKSRPPSSLMFAKISPDSKKIAYVSEYNIYVEDLATGVAKPLTTGGNRKLINGTFDWAYEEEFFCRDGFRWSPDSRNIAYWQINARNVKDYLMIDHIDSIYPRVIPVEYPIAGEPPSLFKIGVVDVIAAKTKWMNIPYDQTWGSYLPRMEWANNSKELIMQHLNRKQNESRIMLADVASGKARTIYQEKDRAWIDILQLWDFDYWYGGWDWINKGNEFIWASEKDGWRHLYRITRDGKEKLITNGSYDVIDISIIDEKRGYIYFYASSENATQKYLYRTKLDGSETAQRLSPMHQAGTHTYNVSPSAEFAFHTFSNYYTLNTTEWISLPEHKPLNGKSIVDSTLLASDKTEANVEFFKIKTEEGVEMDAWMAKPKNFDPKKKYPVLFFVYTEPWGQEVKDQYGITNNHLYKGSLADDGYFYISIDNRGTPVPKGREWRKAVYRKIGLVNIKDQAMAAKEVLKWPYIDTSRVAVWGWSGGGSATLHLMFQYPEIYKTGISVAAVANQLTYDNIYQERYMGLPQENKQDFINGSPLTYAKNLRGNLLYIHGTGDDNVHYNNAEMLLNELIKHNKQFSFMPYPNRAHGISEGEGTFEHLSTLYTKFLREHCIPGAR